MRINRTVIVVSSLCLLLFIGLFALIFTNKEASAPLPDGMQREITLSEVNSHNSPEDCWVFIGGQVYDATYVIANNNSYKKQITSVCGGDGATVFTVQKYAEQVIPQKDIVALRELLSAYQIGLLSP